EHPKASATERSGPNQTSGLIAKGEQGGRSARRSPTLDDRSHRTRRRGERGGFEGAEGWFWFSGAAETAWRTPGSREVVVCSWRVGVHWVKPASPGTLPGGMSRDPTGRNHIQYEHGAGRGTLGLAKNTARPGTPPRPPRLCVL